MSLALRKEDLPRYTYADYARWEGRWELIDGVAYAMSPSPTFEHQRIYGDLHVLLKEALKDCPLCQPVQDFDWKIDESTVVCPDNMVICHEPENQNYLTRSPALIFEILAPSTAAKDGGLKFRLYESEGVRYYVLVHPADRVLKIYRLHEGRYIKQADLTHESFNFDLGSCQFSLEFAPLWRNKCSGASIPTIDRSAIGGLSVRAVAAIRGVLAAHPHVSQAILFGSRAKGNYKRGSDIDLALTGPVDFSELGTIAWELDDLLLPWEIDLISLDTISNPDLREHIQRVGQLFYSRLEAAA